MLGNTGPHGIRSEGGVSRILMKGAGPAFQIIGTHQKSALPEHISNSLWLKERMPLFENLEITGITLMPMVFLAKVPCSPPSNPF